LAFTDAQRADARHALQELAPFRGATLTDAARNYADFLRRTERTVPVAELVAMFLEAKKRTVARRATWRTYAPGWAISRELWRKTGGGPEHADLDIGCMDAWPQSRVNYRRVLHVLF